MIGFWIIVACLLLGAFLVVLPPLLQRAQRTATVGARSANLAVYRQQLAELATESLSSEAREQLRGEIEQRLIEETVAADARQPSTMRDARTGALLMLALPLAAVGLYLLLGMPALISGDPPAAVSSNTPHAMDSTQIGQMVDRLAKRLAINPQDPDGWVMLARSYTVLGRYADAKSAYERAVQQRGDDAQLLADYADLLAMAQNKQLAGKPAALVAQALRIDPHNVKALALAGTAAYERRDYASAADYWQRLLDQAPAGSELERSARANVAE
ncbi:MAG TPA: c-type cytochrome biogenesis protein CcmI, partial [Burkholderiales bacterium]|nr:c-type cytochrome biogenesis protein CcmI [Burkholderiales bacterium]